MDYVDGRLEALIKRLEALIKGTLLWLTPR
jgi:hypothetical protein